MELIDRAKAERITFQEPSYNDPINVLTEVRDKVRALPTVEAIPISWIEKHIENAGFVAVLNSHSVEFMLRQWYREQAERKEE